MHRPGWKMTDSGAMTHPSMERVMAPVDRGLAHVLRKHVSIGPLMLSSCTTHLSACRLSRREVVFASFITAETALCSGNRQAGFPQRPFDRLAPAVRARNFSLRRSFVLQHRTRSAECSGTESPPTLASRARGYHDAVVLVVGETDARCPAPHRNRDGATACTAKQA